MREFSIERLAEIVEENIDMKFINNKIKLK